MIKERYMSNDVVLTDTQIDLILDLMIKKECVHNNLCPEEQDKLDTVERIKTFKAINNCVFLERCVPEYDWDSLKRDRGRMLEVTQQICKQLTDFMYIRNYEYDFKKKTLTYG
tara:strand:- start:156 stop:494 length:339 start_codon:yes stop_codon:yes gene_type:complete